MYRPESLVRLAVYNVRHDRTVMLISSRRLDDFAILRHDTLIVPNDYTLHTDAARSECPRLGAALYTGDEGDSSHHSHEKRE